MTGEARAASQVVSVRVSSDERALIEVVAAAMGLTISGFCRMATKAGLQRERNDPEHPRRLDQLIKHKEAETKKLKRLHDSLPAQPS